MPWYDNVYEPRLPAGQTLAGPEPGAGALVYDVDGMKRPKFGEDIRAALEAETEKAHGAGLTGYPVLYYKCGSCGQPGEGHLMHMGHKIRWKDHLRAARPLCRAAAEAAYRNLDNLHFEHAACNTSHAFEGVAPEDVEAVFDRLIAKYAEPEDVDEEAAAAGTAQVTLAEGAVRHRAPITTTPFDWDNDPRPDWYPNTQAALIRRCHARGLTKMGMNPAGKEVTLFHCASCLKHAEAFSMQMGHKVKWKDHARACGAVTRADVFRAFNDLDNLEFECATCNQGHEWEEYDPEAPEFNYSGEEYREKQRAVDGLVETEFALYRERMLDVEASGADKAVAFVLMFVKAAETYSIKDPIFSEQVGQFGGIGFHYLPAEAQLVVAATRYDGEGAQPPFTEQARAYAHTVRERFVQEVEVPMLEALNQARPEGAPALDRDALDAVRSLLHGGDDRGSVLGEDVTGEQIREVGRYFMAVKHDVGIELDRLAGSDHPIVRAPVKTPAEIMDQWLAALPEAVRQGLGQ